MNMDISPLWTDQTSELRMTGTWRSALPEYRPLPSPCLTACPVDGRIAEWVGQIAANDYHAAWLTLADNNPFPAIIGRICHHPCQTSCNRAELDETVGICSLERFAGDMALAEGWQFPRADGMVGKNIAIIGGGPAGLSAAYQLLRAGYGVTLFEARDKLGGLLRYGIPSYRLDKAVLDGEIARIVNLGLTVKTGAKVVDGAALKALQEQFDAVYMATGAARPKTLPGLDYGQDYVTDSADFLAASNGGQASDIGARVLVIGGGSAAMDAARSARRLGRAVWIMALEGKGNLPAEAAEITEAREEGIEFETGAMLRTVAAGDDGITAHCVRVDFSAGARRGQFSVTPIAGSEFSLAVDTIIPAIGQDADLERWSGLIDRDGAVARTDADWQTGMAGVYAGGDLASMDRFVSEAIGMGKHAAIAIRRSLESSAAPDPDAPAVPYDAINTAYHQVAPRRQQANITPAQRLGNFAEVQQPLDIAAALAEASRCFSCGVCTYCDNCYFYCPDMAIIKLDHGYEVKTDYCKGCGLCVAECPTGSVQMYGEGTL